MRRLARYLCAVSFSLLVSVSSTAQSFPPCSASPPAKNPRPGVVGLNFSRDGRVLATANGDFTVKLWDVKAGRVFRTFRGHTNILYKAVFSPDEKLIASSSRDSTARIWDVATGRELHTLAGHRCSVKSVAFSPDGKTLASVSNDGAVKLWDVSTGRERRSLVHWKSKDFDASVYSVVFIRGGSQILTGNGDGTISTWDVATGREVGNWKAHEREVFALTLTRDGRLLASASESGFDAKFWDTATGREVRRLGGAKTPGLTEQLHGAAFSPDGKFFATSEVGFDEKLRQYAYHRTRLWDVATGRNVSTFEGHKFDIDDVAFTPDGRLLASGSVDGTIKFWDLKTGREVRVFTNLMEGKKN